MKIVTLKNYSYENHQIDELDVLVDDSGNVLIIPLLFAIHLKVSGYVVKSSNKKQDGNLVTVYDDFYIQDNTVYTYLKHLKRFYSYLQAHFSKSNIEQSAQEYFLQSPKFINNYLNNVLFQVLGIVSLEQHLSALKAFYNFLQEIKLCESPDNLRIFNNTRKAVKRYQSKRESFSKYISRDKRACLYAAANSKRDRLILKMGAEVGLRASENTGLLLTKLDGKGGLIDLFDELKSDLQNGIFDKNYEYMLNARHTKGKKSRVIVIPHMLLRDMLDYYETERAEAIKLSKSKEQSFFIKVDPGGIGKGISKRFASDLFRKLKKQVPFLSSKATYHCLRHTFATELYYLETRDSNGQEVGNQSSALITVAKRLGHSINQRNSKSVLHN